jgi:hypothetical protein
VVRRPAAGSGHGRLDLTAARSTQRLPPDPSTHERRNRRPLFLANAAACVALVVGLAFRPTRQLAALGGVVTSALALGGLVVSYGPGLFGWHEVGFRTSIAVAVVSAVVATIALTVALALAAVRPRETTGRRDAVRLTRQPARIRARPS